MVFSYKQRTLSNKIQMDFSEAIILGLPNKMRHLHENTMDIYFWQKNTFFWVSFAVFFSPKPFLRLSLETKRGGRENIARTNDVTESIEHIRKTIYELH